MSQEVKSPPPPTARVFVGREQELEALRAALADAFSGRGRLVLLVGEPGIGKTRLAEELGAYARSEHAQVLAGCCCEGEGVSAYWPWIQAIRPYVRRRDPTALRQEMGPGVSDIAQIVWEVRERLPDLPHPPPLDAAQARFHLFDSVTTFLTNAATREPLVLIIDDLHWADTPSLLLLQFLARQMHEARLLVIGCYRQEEVTRNHPLVEILGDLTRHEHCQRIFLAGLTEREVARYIELTAGEWPVDAVAKRVHRETEGNPLFLGEIVQLLVAEGELTNLQEGSLPLLLPPGVRETIGKRLKRLSEECRRILTIASVIGQEFGLNVLERVSGVSRDRLVAALGEAADARIVTELPRALGRYRLVHPLIRETLYRDLPITDRLSLHRQLGETLEQLYQEDLEPHLAELAYHFFQAAPVGDAEKAVHYAVRAAERSLALLGYEEAVTQYQRALQALDLAEPVDQDRRCNLLLSLGDAQGKTGQVQKARQSFQAAAEIARKLGEPKQFARAAVGTGQVWIEFGAAEEGLIGLLEEALDGMGEEDNTLRARLLARLGAAIVYADHQRAVALTQQAVEMAGRLGDSGALAYTVTARQFTGGPDDVESRLASAGELILAACGATSDTALEARFWRMHALLEVGDRSGADAEFKTFTRGAEELGQPRYLYFAALFRTMRALVEGRLDEAEGLAREALDLGQRWSPQTAGTVFGGHMFVLRAQQGRLHELEDSWKDLARQYSNLAGFRSALAYLHCECGHQEEAQLAFEHEAKNDFADLPRNLHWLSDMATLSEVCSLLGDERRAAVLYDLLLPYAGRNVLTGPGGPVYGPVSHCLGLLAGAMFRFDEAVEHFEDALSMHTKMGARPHFPYTQRPLAAVLAARGNPGDRDRALGLLAQALETTEKIGMRSLRDKVIALQREFADPASRDFEARADAEARAGAKAGSADSHGEPQTETPFRAGVFRREGDYWTISYGETVFRLKDSVGLRYLAQLLTHPGRRLLATDLLAVLHGNWLQSSSSSHLVTKREDRAGAPHPCREAATQVLDPQARMTYKRRLEELREELEEAQAFNDLERARRIKVEIDFLGSELARGVGLGGRDRNSASYVERARLSVTRAIRAALRNIERNSPSLGIYLDTTIKTGTFCSYTPGPHPVVRWIV